MKRINANWIGVDDGVVTLFDQYAEPTQMWIGTGDRQARSAVTFAEPFLMPPSVTVSPVLIDAHNQQFLRLNIGIADITNTGFTLTADLWDDTRIARLGLRWQAIGALADPDEQWDI